MAWFTWIYPYAGPGVWIVRRAVHRVKGIVWDTETVTLFAAYTHRFIMRMTVCTFSFLRAMA